MLLEDLNNALVELEGEEGVPLVPVELINPNVATIFSKSPRAKVCYWTCSVHARCRMHLYTKLHEFIFRHMYIPRGNGFRSLPMLHVHV